MAQTFAPGTDRSLAAPFAIDDEGSRVRQLRSLVVLFGLYSCVLGFVVVFVTDGADIGSVLAGIAGHAIYASVRGVSTWREASWLDAVRARMLLRARA